MPSEAARIPPMTDMVLGERIAHTLRDVPDFPVPGILFKDITPVLADSGLMRAVVRAMADRIAPSRPTHVVGIESRGFLFGMPLALELGVPFAPARKPGKLPWRARREAYVLEYREDVLEMHEDALGAGGARVAVVDDVLATGGTAAAACRLVQQVGGEVAGVLVLVELAALDGRSRLSGLPVHALYVS